MRPCALSTRFEAPPPEGKSFTMLVTIPLSQRKRSLPRTATRRSQPRSWTAAPERSASISAGRASNSTGVSAPKYGAQTGWGSAETRRPASTVAAGDAATFKSVMRGIFRVAGDLRNIPGGRTHPNYSLRRECNRQVGAGQGERMKKQFIEAAGRWRTWTMAAVLGLTTIFAAAFAAAQSES